MISINKFATQMFQQIKQNSSDIDKNGNGIIDKEEFKFLFDDIKLDTIDLNNKEDNIEAPQYPKSSRSYINSIYSKINAKDLVIDTNKFDYSQIEGYKEGEVIYKRGKGWGGSKNKVFDSGAEILNSDAVKTQIKNQIQNNLKTKGFNTEQIDTLFENVYNETIKETLNTEGMITGRGARGLSKKGKAYLNVQQMVDAFLQNFNKNIAKNLETINKSNNDFDIVDIDYSKAFKSKNGKNLTYEGTNLQKLFNKEQILEKNTTPEKITKLANTLLNNLKPQLLEKAKNFSLANNITFNEKDFDKMFFDLKKESIKTNLKVLPMFQYSRCKLDIANLIKDVTTNIQKHYNDMSKSNPTTDKQDSYGKTNFDIFVEKAYRGIPDRTSTIKDKEKAIIAKKQIMTHHDCPEESKVTLQMEIDTITNELKELNNMYNMLAKELDDTKIEIDKLKVEYDDKNTKEDRKKEIKTIISDLENKSNEINDKMQKILG